MSQRFTLVLLILCALAAIGCEDDAPDKVPPGFLEMQVNADEIYLYGNTDSQYGIRLDPLLNDSIKVQVDVSYTSPSHGTIRFIENEGWFYKPDNNFFGIDKISYTICHQSECVSAPITLYVEEPFDPSNCAFEINDESVETRKDHPIEIRVFANDIVCPYQGSSLSSPQKGRFTSYSYSGSFKNIVYVYYPPKGFVGTDKFSYRLFTNDGTIEAVCNITITE